MQSNPRLHESLAIDAPITKAREHAALANEYSDIGNWALALKEHHTAAALYKECLEHTSSTSLQATLRMLHGEHSNAARDSERRLIASQSGSRVDKSSSRPGSSTPHGPQPQQTSSARRRDVYRRTPVPPLDVTPARLDDPDPRNDTSPQTQPPSSSSMSSSQNFDDSFMMLNGSKPDPQDSFTVFFRAIEGMLDKFSQPVAFATAPLFSSPPPVLQAPLPKRTPSKSRPPETDDSEADSDDSFFMIPSSSPPYPTSSAVHYPPPLFQSTHANRNSMSRSDTSAEIATLKTANESLQAKVADLTQKLQRAEEIIRAHDDKEKALRDSVMMVKREAQRAMVSSTAHGFNPSRAPSVFTYMPQTLQASLLGPGFYPGPPPPGPIPFRSNPIPSGKSRPSSPERTVSVVNPVPSHLPIPILDPTLDVANLKKIKELEDTVATLKTENEQHRASITRYRERWQKLKDNAAAKKSASGSATIKSGSSTSPSTVVPNSSTAPYPLISSVPPRVPTSRPSMTSSPPSIPIVMHGAQPVERLGIISGEKTSPSQPPVPPPRRKSRVVRTSIPAHAHVLLGLDPSSPSHSGLGEGESGGGGGGNHERIASRSVPRSVAFDDVE